ncbi:PLAC8-domain-containing protein [Mycena floridula]|nr:PLAC8-domain-containing protein [Mycena floridula]
MHSQQPLATQGMSVNRLNVKNLPMHEGGREWSNGLCDCCSEPGTCIQACCCPCVTYGKNKNRRTHLAEKGFPNPSGGGCCTGPCFLHCLTMACGISLFLQCCNRTSTRERYRIKGGSCGDCCAAWFCGPCVMVQESQELALEERTYAQRY